MNCDEHRKLSENAGSAAVAGMLRSMETLRQDLRYAARVLWRAKAFTVAAVITLALGIAGTTVMFTLIQGVLLRPLPVHEQDRLILAWKETRASGSARYPFGNTEIESVAAASRLLEHAAGVTRNGVSRTVVTENGVSSYANVGLVTGGFFDVLGVKPIAGRTLAPADDRDGAEPVIVVSSGFWQRRFGGARDVIGRQISLNERPFRIVGVMPPDLDYPTGVEIWQPTTTVPTGSPFGMGARREVNLIGRMRAGVTIEQAASEITSLNERLDAEPAMRNLVPVVRSFEDLIIGDVRTAMLALSAAVGLVLLIASANVANLLLMRGEGRRAELALRVALGAGRHRIVRQILAESLVLALLAGVAGFAIAWFSLPLLIRLVPDGLTRVESIRVDQTVLMFAMAVVLVTALLAGLAPGLLSVRADLVSALRGGASAITGTSGDAWPARAGRRAGRPRRDRPGGGGTARSQHAEPAVDRPRPAGGTSGAPRSAYPVGEVPRSAAACTVPRRRDRAARKRSRDRRCDARQRVAVLGSRLGRAAHHRRGAERRRVGGEPVAEPGVDPSELLRDRRGADRARPRVHGGGSPGRRSRSRSSATISRRGCGRGRIRSASD